MSDYLVYLTNDEYERTVMIGHVTAETYDKAIILAENMADKYDWGNELFIERIDV